MTIAHYVLGGIAALMIIEALWGIIAPHALRTQARAFLDDYKAEDAGWARGVCWFFALLCWAFAWFGQTWAHRILFFIGVFLTAFGLIVANKQGMEKIYNAILGKRPLWFIRAFYFSELIIAGLLLAAAFQGV